VRRGFVTPQPQKRPRSSWHRFRAEQPNERWQADTNHWHLADGTGVEILNLIDDRSRLGLASVPRRTITGPRRTRGSRTPVTSALTAGARQPRRRPA
jgi:transposase InsO family protein